MPNSRNSGTVLADLVGLQAALQPDATACTVRGMSVSYSSLHAHATRVANGLIAAGCRPGSRVAVLSRNCEAFLEILAGAFRARAVLLPLNWRLAEPEIRYIIEHGQAEILLVEKEFAAVARAARPGLTGSRMIVVIGGADGDEPDYEVWRDAQSTEMPSLTYEADDVALQLYTSGTTGLTKGVQLTNRSYMAALHATGYQPFQQVAPRENVFAPAPFFHLNGVATIIRSLQCGAHLVTVEQFRPADIVQMFVRERISRASLAPAMIQMCVDVPGVEAMRFPDLRLIIYGGSPISRSVLLRAQKVFGCEFAQGYGMTETSGPVTMLAPEDHDPARDKLLSCGKPLDGIEVSIVDGKNNPCPPRTVGEVVVRGATLMKGYWRDEAATGRTIVDGWLHTGDAGYFDEEGYLYIVDRVKDMIVSGAENIYPAEVENAVFNHPDVADVAIIGVPDEKWGEAVKALVVPRPGTAPSAEAIIAHARRFIAGYKLPKSVDFVDAIPRNAAGKILRRELRAPYWADAQRQVQ